MQSEQGTYFLLWIINEYTGDIHEDKSTAALSTIFSGSLSFLSSSFVLTDPYSWMRFAFPIFYKRIVTLRFNIFQLRLWKSAKMLIWFTFRFKMKVCPSLCPSACHPVRLFIYYVVYFPRSKRQLRHVSVCRSVPLFFGLFIHQSMRSSW